MEINPLWLILSVNIVLCVWGIRVWRKGLSERWMDQLRDTGAELLGWARQIRLLDPNEPLGENKRLAMANFDRCEEKLLFLFELNSDTYNKFKDSVSKLRTALDNGHHIEEYEALKKLIHQRKHDEWIKIKRIWW